MSSQVKVTILSYVHHSVNSKKFFSVFNPSTKWSSGQQCFLLFKYYEARLTFSVSLCLSTGMHLHYYPATLHRATGQWRRSLAVRRSGRGSGCLSPTQLGKMEPSSITGDERWKRARTTHLVVSTRWRWVREQGFGTMSERERNRETETQNEVEVEDWKWRQCDVSIFVFKRLHVVHFFCCFVVFWCFGISKNIE